MAAMAVTNYNRKLAQMQINQDQSTNQQFTQGCFSSSRQNTNGTKKGPPSDADEAMTNTKWFPASGFSTSRRRRLSFSDQEFLSAWGQD